VSTDIGKIFEKELEKVFRSLEKSHLLGWHRFVDTGTAGGIVAAQPSDYLVALPFGSLSPLCEQRMMFVEGKASEKKSSLTRAAMQPSQRRAISMYRMMMQIPYLVFFWDAELGVVQVWDGEAVIGEGRVDPAYKLAEFHGIGAGLRLNTEKLAAALAEWFELPDKTGTIARFNASINP
jgi:hypothetical protein